MNTLFQKDHSAVEACIRNMWLEKHQQHVAQIQNGDPLVVFAGDSLTDAWQYQPSWTKQLAKYRPLNLGIGGDRTQHLLWRLQHLQLPSAALFSVLIGTNNIGHNSSQEIVEGIRVLRRNFKTMPREPDPAAENSTSSTAAHRAGVPAGV